MNREICGSCGAYIGDSKEIGAVHSCPNSGNEILTSILRIRANGLNAYSQYLLEAADKIEQQDLIIKELLRGDK